MHSQISHIACILRCNGQMTVTWYGCKIPGYLLAVYTDVFIQNRKQCTPLRVCTNTVMYTTRLSGIINVIILNILSVCLARFGLWPSRHLFRWLPEDGLTFSPWPGLQCHSQLELETHLLMMHHLSILPVSCTASVLTWHIQERSDYWITLFKIDFKCDNFP